MIIKFNKQLMNQLKAQDCTVLRSVLEDLDMQIIRSLKLSKEDTRYLQGYSAAVDDILGQIKKQ